MKNIMNKVQMFMLVALMSAFGTANATPTSPLDDLFGAVDLTTAAATIVAFLVIAIGVNFAFKAFSLTKRGVKSV
jgi:hypothetical protein